MAGTLLEQLAQTVVDRWDQDRRLNGGGDLATAVRELDDHLKEMVANRQYYAREIAIACEQCTDELQVDADDAMISEADEHVWVSAWIYVEKEPT